MKKITVLLLVMMLCFTISGFCASFPDTTGHWAEKEIAILRAEGVVSGMGNGNYEPESFVTREQFLKMLLMVTSQSAGERVFFETPPTYNYGEAVPFTDVSEDRWSYSYIQSALEKEIIFYEEYGENFKPIANITREEAAIWIARALGLGEGYSGFTDNELIGKPSLVGAVYEKGIIKGFPDGTFRPGEILTRAQAAVVLLKTEELALKAFTEGMIVIKTIDSKDFDGDGALDKVEILSDGMENYAIRVGDKIALGNFSYDDRKYYSFDLNRNDNYLELAVLENADSWGALRIYRYTGETLYSVGEIGSAGGISLQITGEDIGNEWGVACLNADGSITANTGEQFVHTMLVRKTYRMDNDNLRLVTSDNMFETLGEHSEFTVKKDIILQTERFGGESLVLSAGYTGKIVKTDLKEWIYIETASGYAGWVHLEKGGLYIGSDSISDCFDGLFMAG